MAKEEVEVPKVKGDSDAKKAFLKVVEAYKAQNPAKYELKKEVLEAKLNSL